jgi:glycosyltransferase involved in cell wall biosynthesis
MDGDGHAQSVVAMSLVIATLGRTHELTRLLESLSAQTSTEFEVIVVDQNDDDRLVPIATSREWPFDIRRIHTPHARGISRARNTGWKQARGEIILFPDDDCWYPPTLLGRATQLFRETGADILSGRAADELGRDINGRFERRAAKLVRRLVWTSQIEWMMFVKRAVLNAVDGYDENVGVGAPSPWQAAEGQDLTLRALERDFACFYDPSLVGHHNVLETVSPDARQIRKGRIYGRGMGYVLKKNGFGWLTACYWTARAAANAMIALLEFRMTRFRYFENVALGRWEGFYFADRPERLV